MTQPVSTESPMELSPRERLIQIMKREQALFIRQTLSQKPGYRGGKKAFEYFIRQKIVKAVEADCGDAEALLRAVSGLIENALKYEPRAGRVRIALSARGRKAVLTVQNFGTVIAPEDLPHVFGRFYRSDKARTAQQGHGLGLAHHSAEYPADERENRSRQRPRNRNRLYRHALIRGGRKKI